MPTDILRPGVAGAIPAEAGPGFLAAELQWLAKHIASLVIYVLHVISDQ
jgi:hypothetical protein